MSTIKLCVITLCFQAPRRGAAAAGIAYKQQMIPAQHLILTVRTVLPAFFIIGLIFISIGITLYISSNNIRDFEVDYTGADASSPCYNCAKIFMWNSTRPCHCTVTFSLDQPFENNVFMYYGLSNFYQNHRSYVNSRDDSQLNGDPFALKNPSTVCEPYHTSDGLPIAPCGAIANSLFNDTLELYYMDNGTRTIIPMAKKGIAWQKDKYKKFRNPSGNKNLTVAFQGTTKPVNWRKSIYKLDPDDPNNNGFINEDFLVWMRIAALPTFRKLYRIIQKKPNMAPTLPSGNYELDITYNYPVLSFDGHKSVSLSTISWMGGRNPFLGIAYIIVGSISFFLGVGLLIIHWNWDYWYYWDNFKDCFFNHAN